MIKTPYQELLEKIEKVVMCIDDSQLVKNFEELRAAYLEASKKLGALK